MGSKADTRSETSLTDRLAFWQRQLRLQDWEITLEFGDARQSEGRAAITSLEPSNKEARIRILGADNWPPESERVGTWDEEMFLVHELVHLHLTGWKDADNPGDPGHEAKEQAIDLIAAALWRLERGERR